MSARVIRTAGGFKILSAIAALVMCAAGGYFIVAGSSTRLFAVGVALVVLGIGGFVDTLISRIILDDDTLRIVSIARRQTHARGDFESAKVDGGQVVLMRRDGGWLKLPDTGANALSVRNSIDAWLKKNTEVKSQT